MRGELHKLSALRHANWSPIPKSPGVYWWYFPRTALAHLHIAQLCNVDQLHLREAFGGAVCLYHGMASNLADRVKWHAAQKLTPNSLRSGFLSTFRFTLLALNDFDYSRGAQQINGFFDELSISWRETSSREEAEEMERCELRGSYHYPLNIQGNKRPELALFTQYLKSKRRAYKQQFSRSGLELRAHGPTAVIQPTGSTVFLVSCTKGKQEKACAARDLYVSSLFRKARQFAEASGCPWFILSAKHGLIAPHQIIAPYEQTLNTMRVADRKAWAKHVAAQLAEAAPELSRVVFLAGRRYREFLTQHLTRRGVEVSVPMQGLRIGEQLRWLGQQPGIA